MRRVMILVLLGVLLASGCSARRGVAETRADSSIDETSDAVAEEWPPQNDSAIPKADASGQTPGAVVLAVVDAANRSDWRKKYSLYTNQTVDLATAEREWQEASQAYSNFDVLETRVSSETSAAVRVVYTVIHTDPEGRRDEVDVPEPGEWWPLWKVEGHWRLQWMPRQ